MEFIQKQTSETLIDSINFCLSMFYQLRTFSVSRILRFYICETIIIKYDTIKFVTIDKLKKKRGHYR